jgi:hypothetical protein
MYSAVHVSLALVAETVAGLYRFAEVLPSGKVKDPLNVLSIGPETKLLALPVVEEAVFVSTRVFADVVMIWPVVSVREFETVVTPFSVTLPLGLKGSGCKTYLLSNALCS